MDTNDSRDFYLCPLLAKRYSPRAFADRKIEDEKLRRIFEAARWSASCSNEQPWRFIVGIKGEDDTFERVLHVLTESNQRWARNAPVLMLLCATTTFAISGKPNKWHMYDAGQAAVHLTVQALHEGIYLHQMAGFDAEKARVEFSIPPDAVPASAIAMGYAGDTNTLPEDLRVREFQPRTRKSISEMLFSGSWGKPSGIACSITHCQPL
jgi:nitroreductase